MAKQVSTSQSGKRENSASGNALEDSPRPKVLETTSEEINSEEKRRRETKIASGPRAQASSQLNVKRHRTRNEKCDKKKDDTPSQKIQNAKILTPPTRARMQEQNWQTNLPINTN